MRRVPLLLLLGTVVIALCCKGKIYVADEAVQDRLSDDSDSGQETSPGPGIGADSDSAPVDDTDTTGNCGVPAEFSWTSSEPLILPPSEDIAIKDPTVVLFDNEWLVYATTLTDELSITFLRFPAWDQAAAAKQTPVSANENLAGYKAAPQLFYFAPQDLWYLVYQTQEPAYSTSRDPTDIMSWSAPTRFMPMPSLLTDAGVSGIDYWVICDDTDCYMFFSADNSVLYRARTTIEAFPEGFEGTTEIVMQEELYTLYDACNVYRLSGTDQYLLLVSAIGEARYFQSWTSDRLDGAWTQLAVTESDSFASPDNVTGAEWSNWGISHGEMLRTNPDETMSIDTCNMQYLFSGLKTSDENPDVEFYCLGLLTAAK